MTRTRRLLAGVAALLTICLVATGCDSAPYAATVNGQVVKETTLNAALRALSADKAYISALESAGNEIAGAGSGTLNSSWTAYVLTGILTADAVQQHLAATGAAPTQEDLAAARAVAAANYGALWSSFSAAYRDTLVQRDADLAVVEPTTVALSKLTAAYKEFRADFFTDVCVRSIGVSVDDPATGQVDMAKSLAQAQALVDSINVHGFVVGGGLSSVESGLPASAAAGGSVTCYTAPQMETQPASFAATIARLAPGTAAAPEKVSYGYQVLAVVSRTVLPLDAAVERALSVAIGSSSLSPALEALLSRAHVKVNPAYGAWGGSTTKGYAVSAPSAPAGASS